MVAIAEGLKSGYVAGVGRSLKSGVQYGAGFQTEADSDIKAYKVELDGMSAPGVLAHCGGVAIGEIANVLTLGHLERRSFRNVAYGDSGLVYSSAGEDSAEASKNRLLRFIKRYDAVHGGVSADNVVERNGEGASELENSVVGAGANVNRRRVRALIGWYSAESELDSDDDRSNRRYVFSTVVENDGRISNDDARDEAEKEDAGRVMMYEARKKRKLADWDAAIEEDKGRVMMYEAREERKQEAIMYEMINGDFDFDLSGWNGSVTVAERVGRQRSALGRNLDDLSKLRPAEIVDHLESGYVSTVGVPVVYADGVDDLPDWGRDFSDEEFIGLLDKVYN